MFFSYHILVRKNSNFALIWRYMHDKKKVNRGELLSLNISNACNDLRNYIPTGSLSLYELQNKMSLYLLGQLLHGITLVYEYQAMALCQFANETAKSLLRFSKEEKHFKRKRRPTELDYEDENENEYFNIHEEPKRKRSSKHLRTHSILDLNDPSSYVTEHFSRNVTMMEPMFGADDMFNVPEMQLPVLAQTDEFSKLQNELNDSDRHFSDLARENELAIDANLKDPKVSVGWYDFSDEPMEGMRARGASSFSFPEELKHSRLFEEYQVDQPTPLAQLPVSAYCQNNDAFLQSSPEDFYLEPLLDITKTERLETRRKRKRHHLQYDDETMLTHDDIMGQMNNYNDLLKPLKDLFVEREELQKVPVNVLFNPRPWHIKNFHNDILSMFDSVLKNHPQRPLTFKEAAHYGIEELRRRQWEELDFEVRSWTSEMLNETLNNSNPRQSNLLNSFNFQQEVPNFEKENIQKVSVADLRGFSSEQADDSDIEARRLSSMQPQNFNEMSFIQREDSRLEPDDFDVMRISEGMTLQTAKELSQRTFEKPEINNLYQDLIAKAGTNICKFSSLVGSRPSKQFAAQKFAALLSLLKQREVKVKQVSPYSEIFVRAVAVSQ